MTLSALAEYSDTSTLSLAQREIFLRNFLTQLNACPVSHHTSQGDVSSQYKFDTDLVFNHVLHAINKGSTTAMSLLGFEVVGALLGKVPELKASLSASREKMLRSNVEKGLAFWHSDVQGASLRLLEIIVRENIPLQMTQPLAVLLANIAAEKHDWTGQNGQVAERLLESITFSHPHLAQHPTVLAKLPPAAERPVHDSFGQDRPSRASVPSWAL